MLNACKGGAYMVRLGLKKDDRDMLNEGWEIVQDGISRMTDMSVNMLKYVKEWKPRHEEIEISSVLAEIDKGIKKTARDEGVAFHLNVPDDLPVITCDVRMIHSSVMDLVSNALDSTIWKDYKEGESPFVILSAYMNGEKGKMVIEVEDNGCGMTEEVKEKIFAPFFSTKSKSGTGLGLAITARMIGVHDGEFEIESEPDMGTTFRILLPLDRTNKFKEAKDEKSVDS
jgi:signal transduction histidine kinase